MLRALKEAGKSPLAYRYHMRGDKRDNPEFVLSGSASAPVVYHLFGTAREPGSLVLSENDLLDFLIAIVSERPPLPNSLSRGAQAERTELSLCRLRNQPVVPARFDESAGALA